MAQHGIFQSAFAVAGFEIATVIDAQTVFHFQMRAIGHAPFAQQKWKIAIEKEMIGATRVHKIDIDASLASLPRNLGRLELSDLLLRICQRRRELNVERATRFREIERAYAQRQLIVKKYGP